MKLMIMSRNDERELFLKYIVDVYCKNPNLSVSNNIIYNELTRFSTYNDEHYVIDGDSLVGVQVGLNNKFRKCGSVNTFSNGYFWVIENRVGRRDFEFYSDISNAVKLYVSVDPDNIYKISELLFNFMIKENIVTQSKISKGMRSDALVCRVYGKEAAIKVCEYLNGLNYESKFKPNPFLLDNGKVSMAMDGTLSYNSTLAKLLEQYFYLKKSTKQLDDVCCKDFNLFVKSQIDMLSSKDNKNLLDLYDVTDEEKCRDFLMVCNLISKNLDNTLTLDGLFKYGEIRSITSKEQKRTYSKYDKDKILYVINGLANYYSVYEVHNIIMKFIETGEYRLFTRRDDIRTVISDNFSQEDVKNIVSDLGYKAFVSAAKTTYNKYGEEQMFMAIKKMFDGEGLNGFTNDFGVRSRLGLVIPPELLREIIVSKLNESGKSISSFSLANMMLEEIGKLEEKKNIGSK